MRISEKWMIAAVCAVLIVVLSNFFYRTTVLKHLDSVFLLESAQSVLTEGRPTSQTVSTWPEALSTFSKPAAMLCQSTLERKGPATYNVLDNHAYVILYVIAPLTALLGSEPAFAFLNALAHILLVALPFCFLRKSGVRPAASLLFSLCILLYPAWTYSAVGDYYLDRLYMPLALLSLYAMYALVNGAPEKTKGKLLIAYAASTALAVLFTERAAIMMMAQILFFLIFFPQARNAPHIRNTALLLMAGVAAYLYVYFHFFFHGFEGGGSIAGNLLATLHNPSRRLGAQGIPAFFAVNMLFLGVFICFSGYRYILLALGAILPNLLISTGGAELNGWSTHYHAMYIPFLIFTASVGYARWINSLENEKSHRSAIIATSVYIVLIAGLLNPYTGKLLDRSGGFPSKGIVKKVFDYYLRPGKSDERNEVAAIENLVAGIPPHTKISTTEGLMPSLYRSRSLSYFPIDLYGSDYVIVPGRTEGNLAMSISGAVSYLGPDQALELNRCLLQRMTESGFFLFKTEPSIGVLVFKRTHPAS